MRARVILLILIFVTCFTGSALAANSWYIKPNSDTTNNITYYQDTSGGYDQSKWASATTAGSFNSLIGSNVADGDTVYVMAGTYTLSAQIDLSSKVVYMYGGFSGGETSSNDRDIAANSNDPEQK